MASFPLPPGAPKLYPNTSAGITAPSLADWQFEYNGLTFGAGTNLGILKIEGLGALPTVGSQDVAFPRDTGEWQGVDAMAGRDPIIDLWTSADVYTQFRNVGAAAAVDPYTVQPLWFQLPSFEIICSMCRPRKRTSTWDADTAAAGQWAPTLAWHANDPRLYGQGQVEGCASGSGSSSITADNAGNCEMRPVVVLTGPLTSGATQLAIYNDSLAGSPGIVFQSGVSVASGDQVAIDLSPPHLVTYYVGSMYSPTSMVPVYNWLDFQNTTWWNLPVGTNNFSVTAEGSIPTNGFMVWWSNSYLL